MGGGDLLLPESEGTPLEGKFPGLLELGWGEKEQWAILTCWGRQ